jgi:hypothetical protein
MILKPLKIESKIIPYSVNFAMKKYSYLTKKRIPLLRKPGSLSCYLLAEFDGQGISSLQEQVMFQREPLQNRVFN